MRIVGEIPHPILKITVFLHDSKYSIKFESGLYEMTYKFRSGDLIDSIEAIQSIIDESFIAEVMKTIPKMHQQKLLAIERWKKNEKEEEFDEII